MVRRVNGKSFHEKSSPGTRRGAFSPEHRWLHHRTSATHGDEELMAEQL
jgi:hypothetical protein